MSAEDPDYPPSDPVHYALARKLGAATASRLSEKRGTGRRLSAYYQLLASMVRALYPCRVALIGHGPDVGDGIEALACIWGVKGAARKCGPVRKCLYVLYEVGGERLLARIQRNRKFKARLGTLVMVPEPFGPRADALAADGHALDAVVFAPPASAGAVQWAVDALTALRPMRTAKTQLLVCRRTDPHSMALVAKLREAGWKAGRWADMAILAR